MSIWKKIKISAAAAVIGLLAGTFAEGRETLKIGAILSKTGFAGASEMTLWDGLQLYQDWLNKKGGLKINKVSYDLQFVLEDGQSSAEGAAAAATRLINDHKVKFIIGPIMPFMVVSSGKVTEPAKILRVVLYNCFTPEEYGPNTPYTFLTNDVTVDYMTPDLQLLKEKYPKVKNIAVLTPDDGAPKYLEPVFKKKVAEEGLNFLSFITWPLDAKDFTPYVQKALDVKPDALFLINGWPLHMGPMLKIARELGFKGPMFGCHEDPYEIAALAGPAAANDFFIHNLQLDSPDMTKTIKEIVSLSQAKLGKALTNHVWAWQAAYGMTQAIEKADSLDPTVVAKSWEKLNHIDTVYGPGKMGGMKTYGINHNVSYATPITSLKDGKVVWVEWRKVPLP